MEIRNGGTLWMVYVVNVYCEKIEQKHATCVEGGCYYIIHRISAFGDE